MMSQRAAAWFAVVLTALLAGCQQPRPTDMTLQRGSQLLAAGSPKSAIPFLTQTIASTPDGPEPVALLSLAYALDQQADRAIAQARQVRRPADAAPGWEAVAMGIAEMTRRQPGPAQAHLQRVTASAPADSAISAAARQWLAMSQVLAGQYDQALETLGELAQLDSMRTSVMLWSALIYARQGRVQEASQALAKAATGIADPRRASVGDGDLSGQALYDSAVAAVAAGQLDEAQDRFLNLQRKDGGAGDTQVWLALIAAAIHDWQTGQDLLKDASQSGPPQARGLAHQLLSVASALDDRPDKMIEHMLTGQRLLGRNSAPTYIVEQPKPESVWFSDMMK